MAEDDQIALGVAFQVGVIVDLGDSRGPCRFVVTCNFLQRIRKSATPLLVLNKGHAFHEICNGNGVAVLDRTDPRSGQYALPDAHSRAAVRFLLRLAVGSDGQFRHLCAAWCQPAWATDSRFATNAARVAHRTELEALLASQIAAVDGDELLAELARRAVPAGAVRTVGEALTQPAAQAMLLPGAEGLGVGLRTVAFRSPDWAVAAQLSGPPALGTEEIPR